MPIITADFETFWSQDYTLKKLSTQDYILDDRFQAIMCAVKVDRGPTEMFVGHKNIAKRFAEIDWDRSAFLAHNARFDAAILAWRFGIEPKMYLDTMSMARACVYWKQGSSSLAKVAEYLELPAKGDEVHRAQGKRLEDFTPEELSSYAAYCKLDNELCREIFDKLVGIFSTTELRVIDLLIRMFVIPQVRLDQGVLTEHLGEVRRQRENALNKVAHIDKSVFSSNLKFAALLREYHVDVPMKTSPTTDQEIPALSKSDWGFKELVSDESQPIEVQALLMARLGAKSTLEETRTYKLLQSSLAVWPGQTDGLPTHQPRWAAVPIQYYGARCMPGHAEVLTPCGWERLDTWDGGPIAQVSPDMDIEFLPATRFVGPVEDKWVKVEAPYVSCDFTPGHTVPYLRHWSWQWDTLQAVDLLTRKSLHVPVAGTLRSGGAITPAQMRVLAMVQADGHWQIDTHHGRELRIKVKKERKIERARELFRAAEVTYRERVYPSTPGFTVFLVSHVDWPAWLTPERKVFGPWLLDSTPEAREALMHELHHWDGWVQGGQISYSTSVETNADWIMTLAHLTGRSASLHRHERGEGRTVNYRVQLRQRSTAMIFDKHVSVETVPQATYCATTQTGFFLVRSNGHIFVTGNTGRVSGIDQVNWLNLRRGSRVREAIQAPPGFKIVHRDASQIEARMVAWLSGCTHLTRMFAEGRDVYAHFAADVGGKPIEMVNKIERHVGKTCILGLGYNQGAHKLQHTLYIGSGGTSVRVADHEAQALVDHYRREYAEIPILWKTCEFLLQRVIARSGHSSNSQLSHRVRNYDDQDLIELQKLARPGHDSLWLPNNMCISYPGLRYERDPARNQHFDMVYDNPRGNGVIKIYGGKVCENLCQALARIIVTDISVRMFNQTGYHPFLHTYDSLDYCVPEQDVGWWDRELTLEFSRTPDWAVGLPLASEGGWGNTLASAERGDNQ